VALPLRDDSPVRRTPWVTYGLILACTLVFLFVQPPPFQRGAEPTNGRSEVETVVRFEYRWAAVPCEVSSGRSLADGANCDSRSRLAPREAGKSVWVSLLTHLFLHGSLTHLAGNMLFLWVFGRNVEDRFGPLPYLGLYLVTGLIGTLVHVTFHSHQVVPVLGASGAIAGVMGAYLVIRPRGRILALMTSAAIQVVYVPAFVVLGLFFVTQFLTPDADQVAWQAHVGGMVAGVLLGLVLRRFVRDRAPAGAGLAFTG